MLRGCVYLTVSNKFKGATNLTLADSSSIGNEPGTFEVIRAWGLRVHLGYKKGFKEKYRTGSERAIGFGRYSRDVVCIDVMSSRTVAVKCIENIQVQLSYCTE